MANVSNFDEAFAQFSARGPALAPEVASRYEQLQVDMAQLAKSGGAALVSRAARAALRTARREERSRQCDERTLAAAATASIAPSVSARSAIVPRLAGIPAANNGGSFRTGRSSARLGYSARASSRMASARPSARSARGGGSGGGGMLSARSVASSAAASTKSWQDEAYWLQKEADEKYMRSLRASVAKRTQGNGSGAPAISEEKIAWYNGNGPPYTKLDQPPLYQWCTTSGGVVLRHKAGGTLAPAAKQEYLNYAANTGFGNRSKCCPDNPTLAGSGVWAQMGRPELERKAGARRS
jgi:hypothetical protein